MSEPKRDEAPLPWRAVSYYDGIEDQPAPGRASIAQAGDGSIVVENVACAIARRIVRAVNGERALREALRAVLAEPYGCPMCDAGKLRNALKGHWSDCPYVKARAALRAA